MRTVRNSCGLAGTRTAQYHKRPHRCSPHHKPSLIVASLLPSGVTQRRTSTIVAQSPSTTGAPRVTEQSQMAQQPTGSHHALMVGGLAQTIEICLSPPPHKLIPDARHLRGHQTGISTIISLVRRQPRRVFHPWWKDSSVNIIFIHHAITAGHRTGSSCQYESPSFDGFFRPRFTPWVALCISA